MLHKTKSHFLYTATSHAPTVAPMLQRTTESMEEPPAQPQAQPAQPRTKLQRPAIKDTMYATSFLFTLHIHA